MRVVHIERHLYGISSPVYNAALHAAANTIPGMRWDPAARAWVGYADAVRATCDVIAHETDEEVEDAAELTPTFDYETNDDGSSASATKSSRFIVNYEGARAYQREDIDFMLRRATQGPLLAWDMGLGKTLAALRWMKALAVPALVVCPNSARGVWGDGEESQVKRWWPEAWPPRMLSGTKPVALEEYLNGPPARGIPHKLTVCHYDILHAWKDALDYVHAVVFDEVHTLGNGRTRRSEAARQVARRATYRAGLSGTPMTNRPKDLFNIVDTLSEERFGKYFFRGEEKSSYALRYTDAHQEQVTPTKRVWKFDGASHQEELAARMQFLMRRRTKADVGLQLPPLTRQIVEVDVRRPSMPRASVMLGAGSSGDRVNTRELRRALDVAADQKLPVVAEMLIDDAASGTRIVCFTYRRSAAEYLATAVKKAGISVAYFHGGIPQKERDRRIRLKPQVLIATIDTAGVAIDLTAWHEVIFAELTYEPHELLQAEARVSRFGQGKHTLVKYIIARGTADVLIKSAILHKLAVFEKVIGGAGGLEKDLAASKAKSGKDALKRLYDTIMKGTAAT